MKAIQVVFVINTLEHGGAERVLSTLANSFDQKGMQVVIACMNTAIEEYGVSERIKIVRLVCRKKDENLYQRVKSAGRAFINLVKLLRRTKPDAVISFMTGANLLAGLACGLLRIPYVVSERIAPNLSVYKLNKVMKLLSLLIYRNARAIVIPAEGMKTAMKRHPLFSRLENYRVIHNPVHDLKSAGMSAVHHRKFILSVGRLTRQKGFDILIEAYSRLQISDTDLLIIGEGPERRALLNQIVRLGLHDRVFLLGLKEDLQDYYNQAEAYVLSSRNEGYPNALIEAMNAGCACIAVDCEFGPAEIIKHKFNGMLVAPNDIDTLYKTMYRVLFDPKLQETLRQNACIIRETNSLKIISGQWESLVLQK